MPADEPPTPPDEPFQKNQRPEAAASDQSMSVEELIDQGYRASETGNLQSALEFFMAASRTGDGIALLDLGNTYHELGSLQEALEAYEASALAGETSALFNAGQILEELGRIDEALDFYDRAWRVGDPKGAIGISWILDDRGERLKSLDLLRQAADAGDDYAAGVLGVRLWNEEHSSDAEDLLTRAQPLYPLARPALARIYEESGRFSEALEILRTGASNMEIESFLPLGNLLADSFENLPEAEAAYRMGLSLGDENCRLNLGILLHKIGSWKEGTELIKTAAQNGDELAERFLENE